ncbi:kinase-like domain-containing protein [Apodospora peruviana]|uniref:non-specific serine/threonine protein kinase n=1 Tax=Apodospora peruviana TaxID=516989 RepID=A0AAE0M1P9_9PEZI|nr:kinase-like domain-containing protein [Apodospora peruviana]
MEDPGDGWQKVLPNTHTGIERLLSRVELEAYERQILKEWEAARGHWSGIGRHTPAHDFTEAKKLHHHRFKLPVDRKLGSGSFGIVEKVHFSHGNRTICLARKHIQYHRRRTIQLMREEANVMEKLDHEHIVKLVGTYAVRPNELFILLWPVATCNLDDLFNDLDALKLRHGDRDEIVSRLAALELTNLRAVEQPSHRMSLQSGPASCPLKYLQQLIGCITRAVAYCHEANIRHLDLKPSNILLSPGRVYLADFGIARDVHDRDHTMTIGAQGTPKWRAPEILNQNDEWSMKAADVYSLGLVLLNIATVLYGADMADYDAVVGELSPRLRAEKLEQYHTKLESMALATQEVADPNAPTFLPRHIVGLTSRMLSPEPSTRPVATQVDIELVELGGIDQIYHSPCCKKSSRFVMEWMSSRLRLVAEERNRLLTEDQKRVKRLEVLEAKDETYETRIRNERKLFADKIAVLQSQLEKERSDRKKAESLVEELQRAGAGRRPHRPSIPRPTSDRTPACSSPAPGGLMMRRTHPIPTPSSQSPSPQAPQRVIAPTVTFSARPTYSQLAAAAISPPAAIPSPVRRESIARVSPSLIPVTNSPTPDSPGYPLRSRTSGSRLPQPVHPATPIRSGTPSLNRDPSSTDSTQFSMSSSMFSRLSGQSRYSAADTSVAGTPAMDSSPLNDTTGRAADERASDGTDGNNDPTASSSGDGGVGLGLGFETLVVRRESMASDRPSIRDSASVVSSSAAAPPGTLSPVLSSSALSSPRATYAVVDPQTGGIRLPPLPTARSWADVARRERRG